MKLGIMLLTYNRMQYAKATIEHLFEWAAFGDLEVRVHIGDDGSPDGYLDELLLHAKDTALRRGLNIAGWSISNADRAGYGASYNLSTQALHEKADFILVLEDDWQLMRPLDLADWCATLAEHRSVKAVRFGYLGFTSQLGGSITRLGDKVVLLLDPLSTETHVNAGHPRLETVAYQRNVGPWAEGLSAGDTEIEWCNRLEARIGVAYPLWDVIGPFCHIGTVKAEETV
jgi:glycosyltransferase involved in cell wall biosynthesis